MRTLNACVCVCARDGFPAVLQALLLQGGASEPLSRHRPLQPRASFARRGLGHSNRALPGELHQPLLVVRTCSVCFAFIVRHVEAMFSISRVVLGWYDA